MDMTVLFDNYNVDSGNREGFVDASAETRAEGADHAQDRKQSADAFRGQDKQSRRLTLAASSIG
jgi:hypothetical protein